MLKQPPKKRLKTIVRAYGFPILFGIIFACVLVYFVRPSQIEGESMEPTLKDGQLIFCSAALKGRYYYCYHFTKSECAKEISYRGWQTKYY